VEEKTLFKRLGELATDWMKKMLKTLRARLTFLYLIASVVLALAVGAGTYSLVNYYFRETNDNALKVKMGLQFVSLNIPLPLDLYDAVKQAGLVITNSPTIEGEVASNSLNPTNLLESHEEGLQESELADIYVLPLTLEGDVVLGFNAQPATVSVDSTALRSAIVNGFDLRTITASDGTPVRILTYLVPDSEQVKVFQVGKYLSIQQIVLRRLMNAMILLGGLVTLVFGFASWLLAGRTLKPTQEAWDKQQEFIANASHELRTPLTLIHAGVEVGLRQAGTDKQREVLTDVLADANHMNKLIEELLLLSRLDAQSLKLEIQKVHLPTFLPEILRQMERIAKKNQLSWIQNILDVTILADPVRLKQILLVLLDNAIRNTLPGGSVTVDVIPEGPFGKISVCDTGAGIEEEHLEKVFDRFFRPNDRSTSDYQGSGLGLSIAKALVEQQNGRIVLDSKKGVGTEVSLRFPIAK
jgi:signal transduction histidine kinase